ncbi:hypothetical protein QJQ45_009388 [Haematococcus lacustris]|nr:hypothetical protein QJQ45_009388 [Haematococcus lacustris]
MLPGSATQGLALGAWRGVGRWAALTGEASGQPRGVAGDKDGTWLASSQVQRAVARPKLTRVSPPGQRHGSRADDGNHEDYLAAREPAAEPTKGKGKAQGKAAKAKPAPQPGRWLDRDCKAALNMQRIGESKWCPLELCYWPKQGKLPAEGKKYPVHVFGSPLQRTLNIRLCVASWCRPCELCRYPGRPAIADSWAEDHVPEDSDSDILDRGEALQPDLTEAGRNRKVSGEARAARDRKNTYHGRKCKLAHLIHHLPQELWDAFLVDAVQPRVEACSERAVLASLLLGLLVRSLFTIHVADPLGLHGQPVYTDIPVSQAAIPDLSCRNLFLQLCRGSLGNGANRRPSAAVATVLAAHPDLRNRLAAVPRFEAMYHRQQSRSSTHPPFAPPPNAASQPFDARAASSRCIYTSLVAPE